MKERKKIYSFRLDQHRNAQLTKLASHFKMDRTAVIEYMIDVWAQMWVDAPVEAEEDAKNE